MKVHTFNKSQPEAVKLWLDALRSGEHKQGRSVLHLKDDSKCCLGVACHVYMQHEDGLRKEVNGSCHYNGCDEHLPELVQDWLGLSSDCGSFPEIEFDEGQRYTSLTSLNDDAGKDFKQIADFVESKPAGLFKNGAESRTSGESGETPAIPSVICADGVGL